MSVVGEDDRNPLSLKGLYPLLCTQVHGTIRKERMNVKIMVDHGFGTEIVLYLIKVVTDCRNAIPVRGTQSACIVFIHRGEMNKMNL